MSSLDIPALTPAILLVMLLAVFILGLSKGGFAGIGMMSTPLLSLVLPPPMAAGILLPILIFQDAVSTWAYRRTFDRRNLRLMLPAAVIGVLAGAAMVSSVDRAVFEIALGTISVLFGIERLFHYFGETPRSQSPKPIVGFVCGALSGFTSMIAHAGMPPFQLFVLPQRLPRDVFVGTSVMFYAVVNVVKLPFFLTIGQVTMHTMLISAALVPIAFLSVRLGISLVRQISSNRYILVANVILIGIGVLLIGRGLAA